MSSTTASRFEPVNFEPPRRHLRDWLTILWHRRWWALGTFAVTLAAVGTFTALQDPVYRASAKVAINQPQGRVLGLAETTDSTSSSFGGILAQERFLNTQYEIIRSHIVLDRVVERAKLRERAPFKNARDPAEVLLAMLRIDTLRNTNVAMIEVRASKAEEAAELANAIATTYADYNISSKLEDFQRVRETLTRELQKGLGEMEKITEQTLEYTKKTEDLPGITDQMLAEKISSYERDLITVRSDLTRADAAASSARAASRGPLEAALSDPTIASDSSVQTMFDRLRTAETELQTLRTRYTDRHEDVRKKQAEVDGLREKLASAVSAAASRAEEEARTLRMQRDQLESRLRGERQYALGLNVARAPIAPIASQAETSRSFLEKMMSRLNEVDILPAIAQNNVQVIEKASVPRTPYSPKRLLNLALGLVLGAVFGVGLAFFVDYLDVKVKSTEDVEKFLRLPILAVIPTINKKTERHAKEGIQNARTGILFASRSRTHRSLLLTSTTPQEGKSFTTVNLARAFAQAGEKVVVLECDFRVPAISKLLGVARQPGLSNYLAGPEGRSWREVLRATSTPNLFVLPTGDIPPNPPDLLSTQRMTRMLQELREEFDWVLVDSPPVASMSDAQILASLVDMVVFVIRHGAVDKQVALRALQTLKGANPNVIGAILNAVEPSRTSFPEYYYGADYYLKAGSASTGGPELVLQASERKK